MSLPTQHLTTLASLSRGADALMNRNEPAATPAGSSPTTLSVAFCVQPKAEKPHSRCDAGMRHLDHCMHRTLLSSNHSNRHYRCCQTAQVEVQTPTMAYPNSALRNRASRLTPGKTTIASTGLVLRLHRKPRNSYLLHGHAPYPLLVRIHSSGTRVCCEVCLHTASSNLAAVWYIF